MFTVCSYCHAVTGEVAPYHQFQLSHGICPRCAQLADAHGNIPFDAASVDFVRRLLDAAMVGDHRSCRSMLDEGIALGFRSSDLLIMALSGVLNDVGRRWEVGEITHHDEHRATAWCLSLLGQLPALENPRQQLDVAGAMGPGNTHEVGLKLAEYVMRERGFSIETLPADADADETLDFLTTRDARHYVVSCALPATVTAAMEKIALVQRGGYAGRIILTGAAIRRGRRPPRRRGVTFAQTIWDIIDLVSQPHRPGTATPAR